jgi:hypothetical protein
MRGLGFSLMEVKACQISQSLRDADHGLDLSDP